MTLIEANRLVAFGLVVLIWLVQLIIYPGFAAVVPGEFVRWHARYTRAITWLVAPLMLAQVGLLGKLLLDRPSLGTALAAGFVVVAWADTVLLAVPAHERLQAGGHDRAVIARLVAVNWVRTAAWTLAFLCLLAVPRDDRPYRAGPATEAGAGAGIRMK